MKKKRERREATAEQQALTIPQVAKITGKTERATWLDVSRGKLPCRRWGRKVIVLRSELDAFLKGLPGVTAEEAAAKLHDAA